LRALKRIPDFMDADLLWILAATGHGDELGVVDRNSPAQAITLQTRSQRLVTLGGMDAPRTVAGLLELLPLSSFVPQPLAWLDPVDEPGKVLSMHTDVLAACNAAEGRSIAHRVIPGADLYDAAKR
jgi:L-fucose mutarotase